jgi:oxygen-independent coproporphyrinogen-3 oxidase
VKLGVYVHIPFCRGKCDYCNFYSIPTASSSLNERELISSYIDRLLIEIEERSGDLGRYSVDTVYFGGGTPSLLPPEQLERVMKCLRLNLRFESGPLEISLECNPDDFSIAKIEGYKHAGINRVVLGVQTLSRRLHSVIGRTTALCSDVLLNDFFSVDDIVHAIDLIIGIPGEGDGELISDLNGILLFEPEHISAYLLSIEKGTRLYQRYVPSDDYDTLQRRLFMLTVEELLYRGYNHYEISNFALPSFESRHNLKYWRFMPYAGFGAGAHSFYDNERLYNAMSVSDYLTGEVILTRDERDRDQTMAEFLLTGLRMLSGVSLRDFEREIGCGIPAELMKRAEELQDGGFIELVSGGDDIYLKLTGEGICLMDSIVFHLLEPLI